MKKQFNVQLHNAVKAKYGSFLRFAAENQIHPTTVSLWLNGWRTPPFEMQQKVAQALGENAEELFPRILGNGSVYFFFRIEVIFYLTNVSK